jgi:hypothetical protein
MSIPTAVEPTTGTVATASTVRSPGGPVRRIHSDAEAIAVVTELAAEFRKGAVEREEIIQTLEQILAELRTAG